MAQTRSTDYNTMEIINLTSKNTSAVVKTGKGFTKEQAPEAPEVRPLLIGPFAGWTPGNEPVEGTTDDLGDNGPIDRGDGSGANIEDLGTAVGGAMSVGYCCGPVMKKQQAHQKDRNLEVLQNGIRK